MWRRRRRVGCHAAGGDTVSISATGRWQIEISDLNFAFARDIPRSFQTHARTHGRDFVTRQRRSAEPLFTRTVGGGGEGSCREESKRLRVFVGVVPAVAGWDQWEERRGESRANGEAGRVAAITVQTVSRSLGTAVLDRRVGPETAAAAGSAPKIGFLRVLPAVDARRLGVRLARSGCGGNTAVRLSERNRQRFFSAWQAWWSRDQREGPEGAKIV